MQARWKGKLIAESNNTIKLEGNIYFPRASLRNQFFRESPDTTVCSWKGTARYWDLIIDGQLNANAAWSYESPKTKAISIKGMVAFWKGVEIT